MSDPNQNKEKVDPLINSTVGNYTVTRKIGEGGMGSVYLAEHPLIGKRVALKVLHSEFSSNQDVVTRFFNEAKAVNDIQHPNIVDIIDYGTIPGPQGNMVYFIMEHLDGHPLEDVIKEQAPLDPNRCLQICSQVADALAASHLSNIVHRDLKPDNIILIKKRSTDDFVKLLDFGIAKLTGDQPGSSRTRTGIVMGTPAYMSPEQCEGRGRIDKRTDVYAMGVVLYQMLTGRVPFLGEGYGEILVQHLTQPPIPLTQILNTIPPHVEAVCMKALEKNPDARYQCMEDFMAAMADPVAFVEANGGLQAFTATSLASPVLPVAAAPAPIATRALTQDGMTGAGTADSLYLDDKIPTKSKAPIFVGLGVLAAVGVAAAVLLGGGSDDPEKTSQPAISENDTPKPPDTTPETKTDPLGAVDPIPADAGTAVAKPQTAPVKTQKVSAQVTTKPTGVAVYVGDEFIGETRKTPLLISDFKSDELPLVVTFKKSRYEDFQLTWDFNEDQRRQRYKFKVVMKKAKRGSNHQASTTTGTTTKTGSGTKTGGTKTSGSKHTNDTSLLVPTDDTGTKGKGSRKNVGDGILRPGD